MPQPVETEKEALMASFFVVNAMLSKLPQSAKKCVGRDGSEWNEGEREKVPLGINS